MYDVLVAGVLLHDVEGPFMQMLSTEIRFDAAQVLHAAIKPWPVDLAVSKHLPGAKPMRAVGLDVD